MLNRNLPPVTANQFSMVPRSDVPRSTFATQHTLKTTFGSGTLVPVYVDECLPGDVHRGSVTLFCRLATPLFPIMDNIYIDTFFFFVPSRILWSNWQKFNGEQLAPGDSIAFVMPQCVSPVGGFPVCSVFDYFGLPTVGQVGGGNTVSVNALPLRAYNKIYNQWFRDQNLIPSVTEANDNGPDPQTYYGLFQRAKRHDYFTSALPWPTKSGIIPNVPLVGQANIIGLAVTSAAATTAGTPAASVVPGTGLAPSGWAGYWSTNAAGIAVRSSASTAGGVPQVYADLTTATGVTLNSMRLAVATQQLLERDARGGTRYTEILRAHFGVVPEDSRLDRPEYIGGGRMRMQTSAIPQTSATGLTGGTSALGSLGGAAVASDNHNFSVHCMEHGYVIGLANLTADTTYQQGLHRMWTRQTRYDFYWPAFANLGEQSVRNDELYCDGSANDALTFGYQERWAEYRHRPSRITGLFKSRSAGTIDPWHLSQNFGTLPTLNATFIQDAPPLSRALAAGAAANNQQVLWDSVFNVSSTRPLPMYSVPGLDRF